MTAREAWEYFCDLSQRGFLAEENGIELGWIGFNSDDRGIYAHSLFCNDEGHACAALLQAVIQLARDLDIRAVRYIVDADNPHLLRLVESGRATIQSHIIQFPVPSKENRIAKSIS